MFTFTLFLSFWTRILLPLLHPGLVATAFSDLGKPFNASLESSSYEQVTWSADRRLSWEDFKGLPDETTPHHALTAANLAVKASCKNNRYNMEVKCVFLPQQSWSKKKNSEKLLAHEQLHFDLTEVHARQLRHDLQTLSCSNLKTKLSPLVNEAFRQWKAEQDLFDKVSAHGTDIEEQQAWAADIAERLKKLEAYQ